MSRSSEIFIREREAEIFDNHSNFIQQNDWQELDELTRLKNGETLLQWEIKKAINKAVKLDE